MSVNEAPGWMKPAGFVAVGFGLLSFMASGAVGGGGGLAGALIAGALNPFFFVGVPLGIYWLRRSGVFIDSPPSVIRHVANSKPNIISPDTECSMPALRWRISGGRI